MKKLLVLFTMMIVANSLTLAAFGAVQTSSGAVVPGVWNNNFEAAKKYAIDNGMPLLAVWSKEGCHFCEIFDTVLQKDELVEWFKETGMVMVYLKAKNDTDYLTARDWIRQGITSFPFVRVYWERKGQATKSDSFSGRGSVYGGGTDNLIARFEKTIGDWKYVTVPTYCGGYFVDTNAPYAAPLAGPETKYVDIRLVRTSTVATNQIMKISRADSDMSDQMVVDWANGVSNTTVRIDAFDTKWYAEGKKVELKLMDDDSVKSVTAIECVSGGATAGNPKWIGESFDFGEWTMDLDAAKSKVKKTSGSAYTLVSVQGSLWCPDCANVERNFLDVEDEKGNNRFAAWAKSKNIALVSIDIPNFKTPTEDDSGYPSLLSRAAYKTTLARAKEYPQSGADESLTNAMWRSGLGYLTRKMVTDEDAAKVYTRNHELASKNTDEGGFHRPEDGNVNRTGVPIFVLLRKDGSVAARLTRMANVSPMADDQTNFDNYIKRFEEMLWIADNNATEIGNNYPSRDAISFKSNGGSESATLCNADTVDTFYLDGFGGNALQSVTVKGETDAQVVVTFQTTNATGKAEDIVKSNVGKLSDGVTLSYRFTTAGDYFVKVAAADITSDAFKLESAIDNHFQSYTISGRVVLEPQEDQAVAKPPEGSDVVAMSLTEGTVYSIEGMASCASLEPVSGAPTGFYKATAGGVADVRLVKVDGEIKYQVWNPGEVGFVSTERNVTESVCDADGKPLEIALQRTGGKSGRIELYVTTNVVTLADYRYVFQPTNVVWEDGDESPKSVHLTVIDDILFDGSAKVELSATIVDGSAYLSKVSEGKSLFTLTVDEDDKQDPGLAYICGTTPAFSVKRTVYARQSEGAKIFVTRDVNEGNDGLVAGILTSSVKGTDFVTEDPRDLEELEDLLPGIIDLKPELEGSTFLYWAARESGTKWVCVSNVPAGKSATIKFTPVGNLRGISASNTVTVVSVADDAPGFGSEGCEIDGKVISLYRYMNSSNAVGVTKTVGGTVSLTKISGTLPAGLKVSYDTVGKAMLVTGIPSAKVGRYSVAYRVQEKRDGVTVRGTVLRLDIDISDLSATQTGGGDPINSSIGVARTLKGIMVMDGTTKSLTGILQVSIPPSGKVSAKYLCAAGTISMVARGWSKIGDDGSTVVVDLQSSKSGYELHLGLKANGEIVANMTDPAHPGSLLEASSDGNVWTKQKSASDWAGYYTVAIKNRETEAAGESAVVPTGDGYMTLRMKDGTSACNSGTFTIAGMLPDGTRFSGSSQLEKKNGSAFLPIFKRSSSYTFSGAVGVAANAVGQENRRSVESPEDCDALWSHIEKPSLKSSYVVRMTMHGGYYDSDDDLGKCCDEDFEQRDLRLLSDASDLSVLGSVDVQEHALDFTATAGDARLSFNRTTGVVTGSFILNGVRVPYAGVVVIGWGEGCGCGMPESGTVFLPYMSGAYYYSERVGTATIKRGGSVSIDK